MAVEGVENDTINEETTSETFVDPKISHPRLFRPKLGRHKIDHKINLQVDLTLKPCQQPAYPIPFGLRDLAKKKLDYLVANGVISKHRDEKLAYISPCHAVAIFTDDGTLKDVRITFNAKQLNNALMVKRSIPSIPELANDLAGAEWFFETRLQRRFQSNYV